MVIQVIVMIELLQDSLAFHFNFYIHAAHCSGVDIVALIDGIFLGVLDYLVDPRA